MMMIDGTVANSAQSDNKYYKDFSMNVLQYCIRQYSNTGGHGRLSIQLYLPKCVALSTYFS